MRMILFFLIGLLLPSTLLASTPEGYWRTYDLEQNARSIVKLRQVGNTLQGVIVKVLPPEASDARCTACQGKWHNSSLIGLPIIWGLKRQGSQWVSGYVLNVDNGKIYRCNIAVSEDNQTLYFSAYVGVPLFGKTLNWIRTQ